MMTCLLTVIWFNWKPLEQTTIECLVNNECRLRLQLSWKPVDWISTGMRTDN